MMRREGYEVVADWGEIIYVIGFVFLLKEVAFFMGGGDEGEGPMREGDKGDSVSVLQMYLLGGKSGHHIDECLHSDWRTFQGPLKLFSYGYTNPTKR